MPELSCCFLFISWLHALLRTHAQYLRSNFKDQKNFTKIVIVCVPLSKLPEGGDTFQGSVNPRFRAGLPFPRLKSYHSKHVVIWEIMSRIIPEVLP